MLQVPLNLDTKTPMPVAALVAPATSFEHDLACAIILQLVEAPHIAVSPDVISKRDLTTGKVSTTVDWLQAGDPLGAMTFRGINVHKSTADYRELCEAASAILTQRGVFTKAIEMGLKIRAV